MCINRRGPTEDKTSIRDAERILEKGFGTLHTHTYVHTYIYTIIISAPETINGRPRHRNERIERFEALSANRCKYRCFSEVYSKMPVTADMFWWEKSLGDRPRFAPCRLHRMVPSMLKVRIRDLICRARDHLVFLNDAADAQRCAEWRIDAC
jgi:hypothetical protein